MLKKPVPASTGFHEKCINEYFKYLSAVLQMNQNAIPNTDV